MNSKELQRMADQKAEDARVRAYQELVRKQADRQRKDNNKNR